MEASEKKVQEQLPDDIWIQILLLLPAKTLIELKSVCKSWCELINSKNFQISHLDHWRIRASAETKSQLVALWPSRSALLSLEPVSDDDIPSKLHFRPLTFDQPLRRSQRRLSDPTKTTVLHCDDGLLLVRMKKQLFLCNPLTKSYLYLPFPKKNIDEMIHLWTWTFVYDPSSQGYVIFCVDSLYRFPRVFSLRIELNGSGRKIRAWRQVWSLEKQTLTFPFPEIRMLFFRSSLSINGKAHFLIDCGNGGIEFENTGFLTFETGILTIDTATEESIVTKCSGDKLAFDVFFKSSRKFYGLKGLLSGDEGLLSGDAFELWVVDDVDNPIWMKRHTIIYPTFTFSHQIMLWHTYEWILKEGDGLLIHLSFSSRVFIYDISLEKWQEAEIVGKQSETITKLMPIHYSLFSWN